MRTPATITDAVKNVENARRCSAEWSAARDALADALEENRMVMTAATGRRCPGRVKVRSSDNEMMKIGSLSTGMPKSPRMMTIS